MIEVDLELRRSALMAQGVDVQFLRFAVIIDVLDNRIKVVCGIDAVSLATGFLAAGAADGGIQRIIGIEVLLHQIEFEFGRHDGPPAFFLVERQHALQHVARRNLDRLIIQMISIANDLRRGLLVPRHEADGVRVRLHVDIDGAVAHRAGIGHEAAVDRQCKDFLGNAQAAGAVSG